MNMLDILSEDRFQLPYPPVPDYAERLQTLHAEYVESVRDVPELFDDRDPKAEADVIAEISANLNEAIKAWLRGAPGEAQAKFDAAMDAIGADISTLYSDPQHTIPTLYRMRTGDGAQQFGQADLFHIPGKLRHLIQRQRYSFPGVPCLYLGSTSFICWVEMGRPALSNLWIQGYKLADNTSLKFLNLAYRPRYFAQYFRGFTQLSATQAKFAAAFVRSFPLIAACSFAANHRNAPFVVEYIVPQLLLRWVMSQEEVHGIRYFSTHIRNDAIGLGATNYVVPTRDVKDGLCQELSTWFNVTSPMSWELLEKLHSEQAAIDRPFGIPRGDDRPVEYVNTTFWAQEAKIEASEFRALV